MAAPPEQRTHPRHDCELPVVIEMGTETWGGVISNISRGGLLVVSTVSLSPGRTGTFLFILPGTDFVGRFTGTVRWVLNAANAPEGPHCYGIEFEETLAVDDEVLTGHEPHSTLGRQALLRGLRNRKG
jgi:hypothetical protein